MLRQEGTKRSLVCPKGEQNGIKPFFASTEESRHFHSVNERMNLLLTGGMDRIIQVWNPYLPGKPTGTLKSHTAPVIDIHASAEDNEISSRSSDNTIKICLETDSRSFMASSKASGIQGEGAACLYLPHPRALRVASNTIEPLHLRLRYEPPLVISHQEPAVCYRYNRAFRQVVSCTEASVVKVWDFETGRLFLDLPGLMAIRLFPRLVTGGRDGCLKIWSSNNGHCLHTLKHDEKQSEVCDCTSLEVNQNKCIIAVGWDRRINVYFDAPCDFHHFWKPQPHWQDDLNHGHKEDILCVAQCPPFLLMTSSYDGEVIIWNVISGHIYCKLNTPSPSHGCRRKKRNLSSGQHPGPDRSISCLALLKTQAAKFESVATSLITNGPQGSVTFWRLFGGARPIANLTPISWTSRDKAQVSSIAVTARDALAYVADEEGFVHVYDIKEYGLQGPELQSPKNVTFRTAHVSVVTSRFLLSSSLDCTMCLWSRDGAYIGTFGQHSPWDIFIPASRSHPRVPYEILTDPQSMPAPPVVEGDVAAMHKGKEEKMHVTDKLSLFPVTIMLLGSHSHKCSFFRPEKTPKPCSPEDSILEVELKQDINQWYAFCNGRNQPSRRTPELGWPGTYQTLRCHQVACMSAVGEKPDLPIIGSDLLNLNCPAQEKGGSEAAQKEH
ncbi:Hypothetical predicted protein [Lynx pardinus]|uniref:WD repeat-containing protein 49-like n=1 Tax=Lynx pardinus TaxID=191816 RepID=A0A485PK82_LYNPA|nr:Hypothetical predicted protein [Lynx pardinus]